MPQIKVCKVVEKPRRFVVLYPVLKRHGLIRSPVVAARPCAVVADESLRYPPAVTAPGA